MTSRFLATLTVSVAVAAIAFSLLRATNNSNSNNSALAGIPISNSLEPISWPPQSPLPTGVSARPLLFSTTAGSADIVARLPCLRKWGNSTHFASRSNVELTAWTRPRQSPEAVAEFTLARGREAEFAASRAVTARNISLDEFWSLASDLAGPLVYHSGPVAAWGDEGLTAETEGALGALSFADRPNDVPAEQWPASSGPIAWMGSAGVVATPHYDKSLNLVLQVRGAKRWLLWPPEQLDHGWLKLHPHAHPSRRQVRVPILTSASAARAASTSAAPPTPPAIVATVRPGELLFVPPFWTHAVESLTPALSLSVLSPSWIEAVGARLTWPGLPFGNLADDGLVSRVAAVSLYLKELLKALGPHMDSDQGGMRQFAHLLHDSRHARLPQQEGEAKAAETQDDDGMWLHALGAACKTLQQTTWPAESEGLPTRGSVLAAVEQVVGHATRVEEGDDATGSVRRLSPAVLRTIVGDYVESVAGWAVGEEARVGALLDAWARCPAAD